MFQKNFSKFRRRIHNLNRGVIHEVKGKVFRKIIKNTSTTGFLRKSVIGGSNLKTRYSGIKLVNACARTRTAENRSNLGYIRKSVLHKITSFLTALGPFCNHGALYASFASPSKLIFFIFP